jgi:hypothetical protein
MSTANAEALVDRLRGETASRPRAILMSASAGIAIAAVTYKFLRQPEKE